MVDVLIEDRIDVSGAALQKQRDSALTRVSFDHSGSKTREVRRVAAVRDALDGMAREVIDDSQCLSVFSIQPKYTDFRVDRANAGDCVIGRKRIRVPAVRLPAVLQFEPAVFHNPIFAATARADIDRRHVLRGFFHCLNRSIGDIRTDNSVTMAGIDQYIRWIDVKFLIDPSADSGKIVVADPSNFSEGNGVHGDDCQCRGVTLQYEDFYV